MIPSWNLQPEEIIKLQNRMAGRVIRESFQKIAEVKTITGIDTHYRAGMATAAAATLAFPDMTVIEWATATKPSVYPYVPGQFALREGPVVLESIAKLKTPPGLLIFDGHGVAHPRSCGIASHIGVLLDVTTIGCAKTKLIGDYTEPHNAKGSYSYLKNDNATIGAVVRTRTGIKPVFVSIGHRINLEDAIKIILQCCRKYRLPEPIRLADKISRGVYSKIVK